MIIYHLQKYYRSIERKPFYWGTGWIVPFFRRQRTIIEHWIFRLSHFTVVWCGLLPLHKRPEKYTANDNLHMVKIKKQVN